MGDTDVPLTLWDGLGIHGRIDDAGAADRAEVQAPLSHGDVSRPQSGGYVHIGSGPWDSRGRPSEVYLQRDLRIHQQDVRRIGATLDRPLFDRVVSRLDQSSGR